MVGMSGRLSIALVGGDRERAQLPAWICGAAGGSDENATGVWPATTDWIIGPPPPNGIDGEVELLRQLEQLAGQVRRRAEAGMGVAVVLAVARA